MTEVMSLTFGQMQPLALLATACSKALCLQSYLHPGSIPDHKPAHHYMITIILTLTWLHVTLTVYVLN